MRSNATRPTDHVRRRTNQRDLAIARVSRLTTGTAVASALATVGFAGLAALTFSGTTTAAADDSQSVADDGVTQNLPGLSQSQTVPNGNATTPSTQATPGTGSASNTNPTNGSTNVNPPVITTHRRSHVSTGGSH